MSRAGDAAIVSRRLENGLEVRLKPMHTAPLISSWLWYRVGSRNEAPGFTGISHWVEHMQFKGTPTFPSGVLDKAISRDGGVWNAGTWLDWTVYYETMPADRIDLALELEADRMLNSLFDSDEVESERTVIISELEGHENDPGFRLDEALQAAAFKVHSYRHEVIGRKEDLHAIKRQDLFDYYRSHYSPQNAVLGLAGDFEPDSMLERVADRFGGLEGAQPPSLKLDPEPPQQEERRVHVHGPEETPILQLAYHAPLPADEDFYSLAVLDSILSGASSFSVFGGGLSNKTSRLYRALVEGGLAASVHGGLAATIDPYLYELRVMVRPGESPAAALEKVDEEIERLQQDPVAADDVAKAIKQAKALFAYDSESISNQAFWLGYSEMFGDYGWFEGYLERVEQVDPERILGSARRLLIPENRVVGMFIPEAGGTDG